MQKWLYPQKIFGIFSHKKIMDIYFQNLLKIYKD